MGTSSSGKELANKLQKAARASGKANRQAVSAAALAYKEATLASAASDTGGDLRISNRDSCLICLGNCNGRSGRSCYSSGLQVVRSSRDALLRECCSRLGVR